MQMTERADKIITHKKYWQQKQLDLVYKMSVASFDNNSEEFRKLLDDFGTYSQIIWRFDRKLDIELTSEGIDLTLSDGDHPDLLA